PHARAIWWPKLFSPSRYFSSSPLLPQEVFAIAVLRTPHLSRARLDLPPDGGGGGRRWRCSRREATAERDRRGDAMERDQARRSGMRCGPWRRCSRREVAAEREQARRRCWSKHGAAAEMDEVRGRRGIWLYICGIKLVRYF
ncbi:hypothetical protein BRADI_3g54515v3, partial [Brachypodium distachyon]